MSGAFAHPSYTHHTALSSFPITSVASIDRKEGTRLSADSISSFVAQERCSTRSRCAVTIDTRASHTVPTIPCIFHPRVPSPRYYDIGLFQQRGLCSKLLLAPSERSTARVKASIRQGRILRRFAALRCCTCIRVLCQQRSWYSWNYFFVAFCVAKAVVNVVMRAKKLHRRDKHVG